MVYFIYIIVLSTAFKFSSANRRDIIVFENIVFAVHTKTPSRRFQGLSTLERVSKKIHFRFSKHYFNKHNIDHYAYVVLMWCLCEGLDRTAY